MAIIEFPVGGKDFNHGQYRKLSAESVKAYLRLCEGHQTLTVKLERALRIQSGGYCYLEEQVESDVFRLVGT